MNIHKIPKAVAVFTMLMGVLSAMSWYAGWEGFLSISSSWPVMKFITTICFTLSGVILLFIEREVHEKNELNSYVASLASLVVFLFMVIIFASKVFDISVGIEGLFVKEKLGAVKSVISGQPSMLSTFNFSLIAICGFLLLVKTKKYLSVFYAFGVIVGLIGATALLGYVIDKPVMYSYVPNWSNGMSFLSALMFTLIGGSLALIGLKHNHTTER